VIVFAAIAPHGDLELDAGIAAAMEELGRRFDAADVGTAIVVTPHNVHVEGHFAVITSARIGSVACDRPLAAAAIDALRTAGLPVVGVSYGGNDDAEAEMPLDWGTEIPLAFARAKQVVVISPARDRPLAEHVRAGEALRALPGRLALIASADHGHGHTADGPYGFAAESKPYDERICELVASDALGELAGRDPACALAAKADSFWQLLMLHGALAGHAFAPELLSYEVPTYFGMLTASYLRQD
jgi:aromatic ring-opening dioxygenase LigB subunit